MGAEFNCGASSCHPPELSSAVVLVCAWTARMLTYTCSNAPFGNLQLGGSVSVTVMLAVCGPIDEFDPPPQPTSPTKATAAARADTARYTRTFFPGKDSFERIVAPLLDSALPASYALMEGSDSRVWVGTNYPRRKGGTAT